MASKDFFFLFKVRASCPFTPPFLSTFDTDIEKCTSDIFFSTAGASLKHRGAGVLKGAAPGPIRTQNRLAQRMMMVIWKKLNIYFHVFILKGPPHPQKKPIYLEPMLSTERQISLKGKNLSFLTVRAKCSRCTMTFLFPSKSQANLSKCQFYCKTCDMVFLFFWTH